MCFFLKMNLTLVERLKISQKQNNTQQSFYLPSYHSGRQRRTKLLTNTLRETFSCSNDLSPRPPPSTPPPRQLSRPATKRKTEKDRQLADRGGREWARIRIIPSSLLISSQGQNFVTPAANFCGHLPSLF
jgi:hypothetical protein